MRATLRGVSSLTVVFAMLVSTADNQSVRAADPSDATAAPQTLGDRPNRCVDDRAGGATKPKRFGYRWR
jgi:hypothetical protein